MPNQVVWRGHAGEVRWGYYLAAQLGPWTLDATHLEARVVSQDVYRVGQSPLTFHVPRPNGAVWTWQLIDPVVVNGCLTARVQTEES